ncbi:MAG: hypothetical protein J6A62_02750 [Oscillospiraceae bacterium]|nr:hypothetical protein [Oscillospiraceae bacterium]
MEQLAQLLKEHYDNHPGMEIRDAVKFLYQHFMGPGHLISDEAAASARLKEEWDIVRPDKNAPLCEDLGNNLCRLNLNRCKAEHLSTSTFSILFFLTAQDFAPNPAGLEQALNLVYALPFPKENIDRYLADYRAQGCPMVSHSEGFRRAYSPAYRIVSKHYVNLIPVLCAIEEAQKIHPNLRVAIDGPCASGKSTLGAALAAIFRCPLIHMDDFFLRPEQRTPQRLAQPGANVDYERFYDQVLSPLLAGEAARYCPWQCQQGSFAPQITVEPGPLTLVEGCYCLRPELRDGFQLRIWAEACWQSRRKRLLARGGEECLARFEQLWIPLEDQYFQHDQVADCCHIHLDLS